MSCNYSRRFNRCVMLLVLCLPVISVAADNYPLEPPDLSSPRATLNSFLTTGDRFYQQIA